MLRPLAFALLLGLAACGGGPAAPPAASQAATVPPVAAPSPGTADPMAVADPSAVSDVDPGDVAPAAPAKPTAAAEAPPALPPAEDAHAHSVQEVAVTVGPSGFEPSRVTLQPGVPARLVFTRTTDQTCATEVVVPDFHSGPLPLPLDTPTAVAFTPDARGEFGFACGMGMYRGTLVVGS